MVWLAVVVMTAATLVAPAADHALTAPSAPQAHDVPSVHTKPVTFHPVKQKHLPAWHATTTKWPSGTAVVPVSLHAGAAARRAGHLPVWVGPPASRRAKTASHQQAPSKVRVHVAPRHTATAAGVTGALATVSRDDGKSSAGQVQVSIGYAGFQDAYGADWASRLRLVALPGCAATTPNTASCQHQTPVPFTVDTKTKRLTATVTLSTGGDSSHTGPAGSSSVEGVAAAPMAVVAATSTTSGGGGDYSATSLKPSGSWQAGGSTDAFSWSYPIDVPDVPGGLSPSVSLTYDSQSQDGLTSSTNNQASWIGDGWTYSPGFVERSYASCHDNPAGATKTFDKCWPDDKRITLSLNGSSTQLVRDDATGDWHAASDGNEKIEHLTGATNGAHGGEYWRITTDDGTQYYFGKNQLPGYASGDTATDSVFTEPVYATKSGQPCYNATFSSSWCQQAYRWNLDYVVDTHHDTIAYFYNTHTNYYARDLGSTANTSYIRSGQLTKIWYGQRDGAVYSTSPAAEVLFSTNGRCNTSADGCDPSTLTSSTASDWPDVPYDLHCTNGSSCSSQAPSFWSERMLTGITTKVLVGSTETTVDSWSLKHSFPTTGDKTTPSVWLDSITHTGHDTSAGGSSSSISLPTVTFAGTALSNRVDVTDGYPPITRHRMASIVTETGEKISVNYSTALTPADEPSDPAHNTTLAYPDYWTRPGQTSPTIDWFNKYIVTHVTEHDPYGGSANDDIVTTYTPVGGGAWHYNDNPITPSSRRTWDQWRGYGGMTVSTGTAPDPITKTTTTYLRGMDGDTLPNSGTRSVTVTDSRGDTYTDHNQYAGSSLETRVFNGSDLVTDTITNPWTSAATATHVLSGLPDLHAYHVGSAGKRVYTPLASGSTRETKTVDGHDSYGRITTVDDHGDTSTTADDLCTTTSYADNTTAWILDAAKEVSTVSVACGTTPTLPDDAVSDVRSFYDGATTYGTAPTIGDVTQTQQVTGYADTAPTWTTIASTTVDEYGRALTASDADNRTTKSTYTPATGAAPTSTTVTDPKGFATTTSYDPLRGLPLSRTDPAGYLTKKQYDALGRLTGVWLPGRTTTPNTKYSYTVTNTGPSAVDTYTINQDGTYRRSETLYDSLLRARETQTQTPDNGADITDTIYNTDGWVSETAGPYYSPDAVSPTMVQAQPGDIASETGYTYDGAGRTTAAIAYSHATETWRTTYTYGGNFITTVPPPGATATTTVTDARGNTTNLIEYHAGAAADYLNDTPADYDDTRYTYTPAGQLASLTNPAGNSWTWKYNLLGQQTDATDPDTGHSVRAYDTAGQLLSTTDARGKQTTFTYDLDGRKTGEYDTTSTQTLSTSNQLAGWTYDTVKKGLPTSVTSYSGGDTLTSTVRTYNQFGKIGAQTISVTGEGTSLIPSGGLTFSYGYSTTGLPTGHYDPAGGGLPAENITIGYDNLDQPDALTGTIGNIATHYVMAVGYNELGQPLQYTMDGGTNSTVWATLAYDNQTHALTGVRTTDSTFSGDVDNLTYTYGNSTVSKGAGLVTKIVDKQDAATSVDTQCFTYDYAQRLSAAWTATDDCAAAPSASDWDCPEFV
ncbi:RHS repeat domain-containing protein [Actinocatenispora thailandica]|nr:RHS repeat protein [Actinocatenispora thailandica]